MIRFLQLLVSTATIFVAILIFLIYFFFKDTNNSFRKAYMNQGIKWSKETDFSQTKRIIDYTYMGLIVIFLLLFFNQQ